VAADATIGVIVETAHDLFAARGYSATTMDELAAAAGVAVQTIYNAIGGKRAVLAKVLDYAAAGPEAPLSVPDLLRRRTAAARSPVDLVAVLADWLVEVNARTADVWRIIRQAAALDPDVTRLETERGDLRLRMFSETARLAADLGGRADIDPADAAAAIWSLGHPTVRQYLVGDQGWTEARYRRWLLDALGRVLAPQVVTRPAHGAV
jgi:AcrR family transcriptional regulator